MTIPVAFNELTLDCQPADAKAARRALLDLVGLIKRVGWQARRNVAIHPTEPHLMGRSLGGFRLSDFWKDAEIRDDLRQLQRCVDLWGDQDIDVRSDLGAEVWCDHRGQRVSPDGLTVAHHNRWLAIGIDLEDSWRKPRVSATVSTLVQDASGAAVCCDVDVEIAHATRIDHLREHPDLVPPRQEEQRGTDVRFVAVCEGKTEAEYLHDAALRAGLTRSEFIVEGEKGAPRTVVHRARTLKGDLVSRRGNGEPPPRVWAVFDRDEHPCIPDAFHDAHAAGIGVAFSNPCFEAWAILHYEGEHCSPDRHEAQRHLQRLMPGYDHESGASFNLAAIRERLDLARRRARELRALRIQEGNPTAPITTNIDELLDDLHLAAQDRILP